MNRMMARLRDGDLALGLSVRLAHAPNVAAIARTCGYHWLFIDLEHGPMAFDTACAVATAALEAGVTPVFRVPGHDPADANRALTNGALGIIYPHVDTPQQALACARTARFAPAGIRGVPAIFPQMGYDKPRLADAIRVLNAETSVIVMIESREAVENADRIAAQPGVDALFVGASDLSVEMGVPGEYRDPALREALSHVADCALRHGRIAGLGGIGDDEVLAALVGQGYRMLLAGNDLDFFMRAATQRAAALRAMHPAPAEGG
ncbi:MAG: HpcH/HpaI aldolase/citrate lyase family protein [Lautropia sp.]